MDWALFIPLLCLLLLLFLPVAALDTNGDDSSAPTSNPCCEKKTVGSVPYTLVDEADTSNYNCRSNCVYERDDIPGEGRFCFREGQFDVVCNGGPGQGAGKPPFSDPRSAFGFLNGQCIFEQGHSCVEYDQLLPHSKDFDNNSPQLCMDYCRENGYSIAGVAYTKECWCGDTEPTEEQFAPAADCNSFCNGDITQFCGSACRMNVYTIPGNHLPEVFTKPGEFDIQSGNKVTELEFLGEEFVLSFDLLLTKLDSEGFFSILHLTIGDDSGAYGDRTPAVWLLDRGFHIASAISGDINEYKDIILNPPLRTNTWMRFEISQLISNNKHIFRVRVDGKLYWEIENNAPTMFPAVTIFGSNNWYSPASGKIRNIKVRTSGLQPHTGCTIHLSPLATWVRAPEDECLKACSESDGCEAMALTKHDAGNVCRFHALTKDESGPLFKCEPEYSDSTVYVKKPCHVSTNKNINYAKVLEEKGKTVSTQPNLQSRNIIAWANGNYLLPYSQKDKRFLGILGWCWCWLLQACCKPQTPLYTCKFEDERCDHENSDDLTIPDIYNIEEVANAAYVRNYIKLLDVSGMDNEANDIYKQDKIKGWNRAGLIFLLKKCYEDKYSLTTEEIERLVIYNYTKTEEGWRQNEIMRKKGNNYTPDPDDLLTHGRQSQDQYNIVFAQQAITKHYIDNNPPTTPIILHRGMNYYPGVIGHYPKGHQVWHAHVQSYSKIENLPPDEILPGLKPHNVKIVLRTTKAVSVSQFSQNPNQQEYLVFHPVFVEDVKVIAGVLTFFLTDAII